MRRTLTLWLSLAVQLFLVALTQAQSKYYRIDLNTREAVLNRHRQVRQFTEPTDTRDITWDDELEAFALLRAQKIGPYCEELPHDPSLTELGENLYFRQLYTAASNEATLVLDAAEYWRDELVKFAGASSFVDFQRYTDNQRVNLLQTLEQTVKASPTVKRDFGHAQIMGTTRLIRVGCSYYRGKCGGFQASYFVSCLYGDGTQPIPMNKNGYEELPTVLNAFRGLNVPTGGAINPAPIVTHTASQIQQPSNTMVAQNSKMNNPVMSSQRSKRQSNYNSNPNCPSKKAKASG